MKQWNLRFWNVEKICETTVVLQSVSEFEAIVGYMARGL